MIQLVTAEQMRAYEGYLMETLGIPSLLLMERAAGYIKDAMCRDLHAGTDANVLVVSGCGNNGADGLAAARFLAEEGMRVTVAVIGDPMRCSDNWKVHSQILKRMDLPVCNDLKEALKQEPEYIIDAIFGIGVNRELTEGYLDAVRQINAYRSAREDCRVLSVDLPSGLHTDSGLPLPEAVKADRTVTFGYPKRGMYLNEGRRYCGDVICRPIGPGKQEAHDYRMDWDEILPFLPKRDPLGHKGTFGKVLCIAGCESMPGASILNVKSVLGCGAGMVKVLSVAANRDLLMQTVPEAMYTAMEDVDDTALEKELQWADTVLFGSGLGKERAAAFLRSRALRECENTMVIDADGLNALAEDIDFLKIRKNKGAVTFLTPHPGEFARLFPEAGKNGGQDPEKIRELAKEYGVILLAKSATTLVTDGRQVYYNSLGSDALATAGSGDVLAGALAAASCVIKDPLKAAVYADALHAMAGNAAAERWGNAAVTASRVIDCMPKVTPHQSASLTAVSPAGSVVAKRVPPARSNPQGEAKSNFLAVPK